MYVCRMTVVFLEVEKGVDNGDYPSPFTLFFTRSFLSVVSYLHNLHMARTPLIACELGLMDIF